MERTREKATGLSAMFEKAAAASPMKSNELGAENKSPPKNVKCVQTQ